jgi:hypothetical protein
VAGDSSQPTFSLSSWGDPATATWSFTWSISGSGFSPASWLWGSVWQAILNSVIYGPGPENPEYVTPPTKLCGGDDGFNQYARE